MPNNDDDPQDTPGLRERILAAEKMMSNPDYHGGTSALTGVSVTIPQQSNSAINRLEFACATLDRIAMQFEDVTFQLVPVPEGVNKRSEVGPKATNTAVKPSGPVFERMASAANRIDFANKRIQELLSAIAKHL
jgi:hypothetical protein